jgi:hypothetical protein
MGDFEFLEPIPKLTLTPMTMVEEAMVTNPKTAGGDTVDRILRRCIQESIDVNVLLGSDKFFLFMMLRAITYGPDYTFEWTCPAMLTPTDICNTRNTTTVRIPDDFQVKYLADEDTEPYTVRLPDCQREISFRLLRGYDEPIIEGHSAKIEAQEKAGIQMMDTTPVFRLVRQIVKVDDKDVTEAPEDKMMAFVQSIPPKDIQLLKGRMAHFTPGLSTDITLVCEKCKNVHEWDLPFTANFFRVIDSTTGRPVGDEVRSDVLPGDASRGDNEDGPSGA